MSATTVRLLKAACEVAGGEKELAQQLGIAESLLWRFMSDRRQLPDALLLRAVDIILADRASAREGALAPSEGQVERPLSGQS